MLRSIIQIDDEKCNGCGLCIPNCHEGAIQLIDHKARLVSDLFCDGLGACIGHCPEGAITIVEREAEPYNETRVMQEIVKKGRNTIIAHLEHLRDHQEFDYIKEAVAYIKNNDIDMAPVEDPVVIATATTFPSLQKVFAESAQQKESNCGCAGSRTIEFKIDKDKMNASVQETASNSPHLSQLRQWPVQLHLLNPSASYFRNADVLLAADCVGYAMGDFHERLLKGKSLAIACPKLDSNKEVYVEKLATMIRDSEIKSMTIAIMEVPCCGGLTQMTKQAVELSGKELPLRKLVVGIKGEILKEEWV